LWFIPNAWYMGQKLKKTVINKIADRDKSAAAIGPPITPSRNKMIKVVENISLTILSAVSRFFSIFITRFV